MSIHAFTPRQGATLKRTCTTTSAKVDLTTGADAPQVRLSAVNGASSATVVHVILGTTGTTPTATTSDFVIPIGQSLIISKSQSYTVVAARTDTGTADLYVTPGDGI